MAKEKFVYNKHTLRYEKVVTSWKTYLVRTFGFVSSAVVFGALAIVVYTNFFNTPNEKLLKREITKYKQEYNRLNAELDLVSKAVENLRERDKGIYRVILQSDPIDDAVWAAGTGGREKYQDYKNLTERELLAKTAEKIQKLKYKINLQAKSYKQIIEDFERNEDRMQAVPSIKPIREDKINKDIQALSGFGWRLHPVFKVMKMHTGIDFGARAGTPIYATGNGVVTRVESRGSGYGNNVIISHGYGYESLYAHMQTIKVRPGQKVKRGEVIGLVGSTGTSTSPHLHYEIIKDGVKVNPMSYILDGMTPDEYQEFIQRASQTQKSFDY